MKRVLQFFTSKWLIHAIGLAAIAAIIWFGGPYLGLGDSRPFAEEMNRLIAIIVVILLWGVNNLRTQAKHKSADKDMVEKLSAPVTDNNLLDNQSEEEIALLKERFQQALNQLKKNGVHGRFGKQHLYDMPWYVIIGPPGSGKTTLLKNSGLEFPVTAQDADKKIRGIGGTRNCDWWFTNEAILLDTAGRYTTQDSHAEVDSGAWLGFLDLLRKHRPRRPLNGIIVAISLGDILSRSSHERDRHAHTIRQRIQELYQRLGTRIPVYLMFTKSDLIAGFAEFFDDLSKEQRTQVWGTTLSNENNAFAKDIPEQFEESFDRLVDSLNDRMLGRLQQERDLSRRALMNNFPQQMANVRPLLKDFLQKTFSESRYDQQCWLRGIYFTSGTQEGSPIDRVMATLSRSFDLSARAMPQYHGNARTFFIHRFFKDVLFPEANIGGANLKFEKRRSWIQKSAIAACIVVTLGTAFAWTVSYSQNEKAIKVLSQRIAQFKSAEATLQKDPSLEEINNVLSTAKDMTSVFDKDSGHAPQLAGMGLYQGFSLDSAAEQAYRRITEKYLLNNIQARLEDAIKRNAQDPEEVRRVLSVYFMLSSPEQSFDRARFEPWVTAEWARNRANDPNLRSELETHFVGLLDNGFSPRTLNEPLLKKAQRIVCEIPLDKQIYARLQQAAEAADVSAFSLKKLGRPAQKLFTSSSSSGAKTSVPGFFTFTSYSTIVDQEGLSITEQTIEENLRVCEHKRPELELADTGKLLRSVKERYYRDYIKAWDAFLNGIKLVEVSSLNETISVLDGLSNLDSPLDKLIRAVKKETLLDRSHLDSVIDKFDVTKKLVNRKLDPVERQYQSTHRLLDEKDGETSQADGLLAQLAELHAYSVEIANASDVGEAAFNAAQARMTSNKADLIRNLRNQAKRLPTPIKEIINSAATQTWGIVLANARNHVNSVWRATVLNEHKNSLQNRYPFYADSNQDATMTDFGRFFAADGSVDKFVKSYLAPFVNTQRWTLKVRDDRSLGLSRKSLAQLRRASEIRKMFFAEGTKLPTNQFHLKPIFLDADVKRFLLEINGQQLDYRHGPTRTTTVNWPGTPEKAKAKVIFDRIGSGSFSIVREGPWAWFKLLESSKVIKTSSSDKLVVEFATAGLKARYELRANSVTNPFTKPDWKQFRCPDSL